MDYGIDLNLSLIEAEDKTRKYMLELKAYL